MEGAGDGVWDWDVKTNKVVFSNQWKLMLGYQPDEIKNDFSEWEKRVHPEDLEKALFDLNKHMNGNSRIYVNEHRLRCKDGSYKWILDRGKVMTRDENGKALRVIGRHMDITDRRKVEDKLRRSEEKFRKLFQNHSAVKLLIDPENGNIVEANDSAVDFYGWSIKELAKMNINQIDLHSGKEINKFLEGLKRKKNEYYESKHKRANGEMRDVEIFSSSVDIEGKELSHSIVHDITEKKKAESQLKLLSRSVEQSPVSILVTDKQGKIIYINPNFSKVTGFLPKDALGKTPRILKSGKQDPAEYKKLWKTILAGKEWRGELLNKTKNGNLIWENVSISPILDEQNEITHFVAIKENITEKKKMIQDLVAAKEKAEESDRLKSAFLANMSHEIRTPMNGILGFADLLKDPNLSTEEKQQFIKIIESSGYRMLNTINDLIDISKIEAGMVEIKQNIVDVNEQMDYLFYFFKPEAERKGLKLIYKAEHKKANFNFVTDKEKLVAILTNLLKNAIKYTEKGSVEYGFTIQKKEIEFFIQDTGIGIDKYYQQIIFDRFVQADISTSRPYEGSGLGLAITKAYVEMLKGKINLISDVGNGTKFYVSFPIIREEQNSSEKLKSDKKSKNEWNIGSNSVSS